MERPAQIEDNHSKLEIILGAISWMIALTPVLLLLGFLTLTAHVRIGLGYVPHSMTGNYQTTAFHVHQRAVFGLGCFTIWGAMPLWLVLLCVRRFCCSWSWAMPILQVLVFALGWGAIAIFAASDFGHFVGWFLINLP